MREERLIDIKNRDDLEARLEGKPREVAVALRRRRRG